MAVWTAAVLLLWGCAGETPPPSRPPGYPKPYKVMGKWYQPLPHANGFKQRGIASWYGKNFHGRPTSSGEKYNMYAVSAAHKTLPLGTYVRVRNLNNNRSLDVRVNDRGPFVRGRIIDLSYAAAKKLGVVGPGTAPVQITALGVPSSAPAAGAAKPAYRAADYFSGRFTFQVGAFQKRQNAERLKRKLARTYENVHIAPYFNGRKTYYRVRLGKCVDLQQAIEYENHLVRNGFPNAFAIAE